MNNISKQELNHRELFKTTLPISFQFHHAQMDGFEAARFLNGLQKTINGFTGFSEEAKRKYREEHWQQDLQYAFDAGERMAKLL